MSELYLRLLRDQQKVSDTLESTGTDWVKIGETLGPVSFTPSLEAVKEFGASMQRSLEQIAKGFTMSFTTTFPAYRMRRLHRLLISPDDRRCYTCMRRFPGPWQRSKHERRAHRG